MNWHDALSFVTNFRSADEQLVCSIEQCHSVKSISQICDSSRLASSRLAVSRMRLQQFVFYMNSLRLPCTWERRKIAGPMAVPFYASKNNNKHKLFGIAFLRIVHRAVAKSWELNVQRIADAVEMKDFEMQNNIHSEHLMGILCYAALTMFSLSFSYPFTVQYRAPSDWSGFGHFISFQFHGVRFAPNS